MPPSVGPGFEWFVAWRHLRDPERRSHRTLILGGIILVVGVIAFAASYALGQRMDETLSFLRPRPPQYLEYLRTGGVVAMALGGFFVYLGILFAAFTVFTAISIFGVFLGTAVPIIALSVMSGFEADLKGKIRGAKADIVITRKNDRPFSDFERVRAAIAAVPGVVASTPYLETEVMLNAAGAPASVILRGIDAATAGGVLDLERTLREGKVGDLADPARVRPAFPAPAFRNGFGPDDEVPPSEPHQRERDPGSADVRPTIILGEELYSRSLRVFVGNDIDVVCPLCGLGPTGARPSSRRFRVAGHFYSGMYEFDSKLAYAALEAVQRFLGTPGEVTGVDVRAAVPDRAGEVADAIARVLGDDYDVRSWQELNRGLFMALKLEKIAMFIVLTFIALVASFSIISNLIMMVTEKGREVAILKAMGAKDGAILRVFFAEGLYIGLLGLAIGVASGIASCRLIERFGLPLPTDVYYITRLPVVMRAEEILMVAGLALLLCCLATIYPAVLASRLRPVDGLRYE